MQDGESRRRYGAMEHRCCIELLNIQGKLFSMDFRHILSNILQTKWAHERMKKATQSIWKWYELVWSKRWSWLISAFWSPVIATTTTTTTTNAVSFLLKFKCVKKKNETLKPHWIIKFPANSQAKDQGAVDKYCVTLSFASEINK